MRTAASAPVLPIVAAPFQDETVASFVARLATANHLPPDGLNHLLQDRPLAAGRLAALTGRPVAVLARALPELRSPDATAGAPADPPAGYDERPRLACAHCTARRSITAPVRRWAPGHLHVCVTHRRWVGATTETIADQVDLTAVPDVVAAAVHHRNLVRRHGQQHVGVAYARAVHVVDRWSEQDTHGRHRERRLHAVGEARITIVLSDPVLQAVNYPQTVALTSVLASPFWLRMAADDEPRRRDGFFAEVARRLDIDYRADSVLDPIVHWVYRGGAHQQLRALTDTSPHEAGASARQHDAAGEAG